MNEQEHYQERGRLIGEMQGVADAAWRAWRKSFDPRSISRFDKGDETGEMK